MKAITVKQPWASLIIQGIKDIENRTWQTKYRGRVLIHAGMAKANFNFSLSQNQRLNELNLRRWYDSDQIKGKIIGSVEIIDCVKNHPSIWAERHSPPFKPFNWVLAYPIIFPEPIPIKGKLSFWDYPNILAEPEEKDGELFCHCQLPVDEKNQVMNLCGEFKCHYCGGIWYK